MSQATLNFSYENEYIIDENILNADYFTVEALEDNCAVHFVNYSYWGGGFVILDDEIGLYYSIDGAPWVSASDTSIPTINTGQIIKMKASLATWDRNDRKLVLLCQGPYTTIVENSQKRYNAYGNIMSLVYADKYKFKNAFPEDFSLFYLFSRSKIVDASDLILPAMKLNDGVVIQGDTDRKGCYEGMFNQCSSLTAAPELPATTLGQDCYEYMFQGCTSLTTAPDLPAIKLYPNCYSYMFNGCTSLTTAPTYAETTTSAGSYSYMFYGCSSLVTVPDLPFETISSVHQFMFKNCTSLVTPPALPSTTFTSNTWSNYEGMFQGCTSLTTAPELPATNLTWKCYKNMFDGCTSLITAPSVLPATATYNDSISQCYYEMFKGCTSLTTAPSVINSEYLGDSSCYNMFYGCTSLTAAPRLLATNLSFNACNYMFAGCTSLVTVPHDMLPATDLASECYAYMFQGCTSLTAAPELPATNFDESLRYRKYCYQGMFQGCTSLITAPELPATTLSEGIYKYMFKDCTSLTTAPYLPANDIPQWGYDYMFNGCSSLNNINCMAIHGCNYNTSHWVEGVAASGTFTRYATANWWLNHYSGIPSGWTVVDAQ